MWRPDPRDPVDAWLVAAAAVCRTLRRAVFLVGPGHNGGDALVALIGEETHTCYLGERGARHAWGYGCGTCPACELRANGWQRWQAGKGNAP